MDNFKEDLAAYLRKLAGIHSVGELWFGIDPKSKPAGVVLYAGQTLERSLYADHWEYIQNKRTVISEEEWQAKVTSDGFCPFYSTGNGTSNYRMPLVEGVHPKFVAALQEVGEYTEAGLPNITGIQPLRWNNTLGHAGSVPLGGDGSGALYRTTDPLGVNITYSNSDSTAGKEITNTLGFDASLSNTIYGNSDTVTPPSINIIVGEYVVSTQSIYSNTTQNILDRLESLEGSTKLPIGIAIPYTGKDVPAGFLRADGSVYNNVNKIFPNFWEWLINSGLTVPLANYTLVEGSCGFYGIDETTGTVRMPTLAAGVFGTITAEQYGQAVQAGLPNITGHFDIMMNGAIVDNNIRSALTAVNTAGAFYPVQTANTDWHLAQSNVASNQNGHKTPYFDASRSSAVYGKSDTVTPSHVKYPWIIVVYHAAVSTSVAQVEELLHNKIDKAGDTFDGTLRSKQKLSLAKTDDTGINIISGGTNDEDGSCLTLRGQNASDIPGGWILAARLDNNTQISNFIGYPDGRVLLNGLPVAVLTENRLKIKDTESALGTQTSDVWCSGAVEFYDKNATRIAGIQPKFLQNGEMELVFNAYSASSYSNFVIRSDGSLSFKGKDVEALALPSKKWVDLSLGTGGTVYTAPDNGWVYWRKRATQSGQFIALYAYLSNGSTYEAGVAWSAGSHDLYTSIPIRRGEKFLINYSAAGTATTDFLRFIYAHGSE